MVVFAVFKINAVALMVTVFGCFASALAIYTDKKNDNGRLGILCGCNPDYNLYGNMY